MCFEGGDHGGIGWFPEVPKSRLPRILEWFSFARFIKISFAFFANASTGRRCGWALSHDVVRDRHRALMRTTLAGLGVKITWLRNVDRVMAIRGL